MPGSVRVLVVGHERHGSAFSDFLAGKRIRVTSAVDCSEALFRMRCQRVDAVVAGSEAGKRILDALLRERALADLPVIGLLDDPDEVPDPRFCMTRLRSCSPDELFFALLTVLDCHAARVSLARRDDRGICPGAVELRARA